MLGNEQVQFFIESSAVVSVRDVQNQHPVSRAVTVEQDTDSGFLYSKTIKRRKRNDIIWYKNHSNCSDDN